MRAKLSTLNEAHHKVKTDVVLETLVHIDNERMLQLIRNGLFLKHVAHFVVFQNLILAHTFNGMVVLRFVMLRQEYFRKTASTNLFEYLKVIEGLGTKAGRAEVEIKIFVVILGIRDNTQPVGIACGPQRQILSGGDTSTVFVSILHRWFVACCCATRSGAVTLV